MDASPSSALRYVPMPQKPIRVLQVGMSANYGGTEAVVYGIYERLDHSLVQFDFLNVYGRPIAKQAELEAQGAHVYDLLLKRREGYLKYAKGIKAFFRQHASEFSAIVCNVQFMISKRNGGSLIPIIMFISPIALIFPWLQSAVFATGPYL